MALELSGLEKREAEVRWMFDYKKFIKDEKCDEAMYKIRKKYGKKSISFLALTRDIKLPEELNEIVTLPMSHYNS